MHKQSFTVCIKLKTIISSARFIRNVSKAGKRRFSMAMRDRFLSFAVAFVDRPLFRGYSRFLSGANSL